MHLTRPVRALALVTTILVAAIFPAPVAAANPLPIHIAKDCSTFTAVIPSYCVVTASDLAAIPIGATVNYLGPLLDNPYFLSSNARIDDAHGNTATGYCIFDGRANENRGYCTFWAGTGTLTGFTAILKVTVAADGIWHLDGEYYGIAAPPAPTHSQPWAVPTRRPS